MDATGSRGQSARAARRTRGHRAGRRRRHPERGAALVEFAIVAPFLLLILMGIVDFGVNLSNQISLRQGAREAAREASVASFGTTASCGADFTTQGSENMRKLICLTKKRSDLVATDVRVAVRFDPGAASYPAPTSGTGPVGNGIVVCSIAPLESVSKLFSPAFSGRYLKTKTVMRIEKGSGVAEVQANEADPSGANWAWCTP